MTAPTSMAGADLTPARHGGPVQAAHRMRSTHAAVTACTSRHGRLMSSERRHWEERNRVQWSRDRLTALLTPMTATGLDAALGTATITQLKNLTGEVTPPLTFGCCRKLDHAN